jgi:hypothetical protein
MKSAKESFMLAKDLQEGDVCPNGCDQTLVISYASSCSCHTMRMPPCSSCENSFITCPECDVLEGDVLYTDPLTSDEQELYKVKEVPLAAWQVGLIAGITALVGGWLVGQFIP